MFLPGPIGPCAPLDLSPEEIRELVDAFKAAYPALFDALSPPQGTSTPPNP